MSNNDVIVLDSLKLAEELLEVIKKRHKQHQIEKEINNSPPKWLLGRETLYKPEENS